MYYKCLDCGHVFEDGEEKTIVEHHPYGDTTADEIFTVCPMCDGTFEETQECEVCNGHFLEDELYNGHYCAECLKEAIDYDSFFEYQTDKVLYPYTDDVDGIAQFVWQCVFQLNKESLPRTGSAEFKIHMHDIYRRKVAHEKITNSKSFLHEIQSYIMDGPEGDKEDFAEWLDENQK